MNVTALYTDLYQISMGQVYFSSNHHLQHASFDYFFRKLPFEGGYVVFAGLNDLLPLVEGLRFSPEDIDYLRSLNFSKDYLDLLRSFRFRGTIYAMQEGDVVFPNIPSLRVEGTILEAQQVAPHKTFADFGLRRAQGLGAYHATRATAVAGFNSTSNVKAGADFGIPVSGTMAHSFIQHFDNELAAFRSFAEGRPQNCVLLVDTYDTLNSGVPNAITVAREMEAKGFKLEGIRLDSGDLAYLAKKARHLLDQAGLRYVKIAASNQLDEYVIKSLMEQGAPIDIFGVGTNLITGQPDAALDGVYKLSYSDGKPRIKLSESIAKTTLPHKKQVYRVFDESGSMAGADVVTLSDEGPVDLMHHPYEADKSVGLVAGMQQPLLRRVMHNGEIVEPLQRLPDIAEFCQNRLSLLPVEYKRFENPHVYKVGISTQLKEMRDTLRTQYRKTR
jgi:nicotinate phosphoribosyltransferase